MLEAVGDYASISLINARLFQALTGRAEELQEVVDETYTGLKDQEDWVERVRTELNDLKDQIPVLLENSEDPSQRKRLQVLGGDLDTMLQDLDEMPHLRAASTPSPTA
jgi:hypothetical protein